MSDRELWQNYIYLSNIKHGKMVSGILLAAGNSKRMGSQNKLLLPIQGQALFVKMVKAMQASKLDELIVVLGHDYKKMIPHCNSNTLKLAINGNHLEGQTTSIKVGMQLISPSTDAVMICLADMPLITAEHLNRLLENYENDQILRPLQAEQPGNPCIFPKTVFQQILDCKETDGCKSVVAVNKDLVKHFETKEQAYFTDIDTPLEYDNFVS